MYVVEFVLIYIVRVATYVTFSRIQFSGTARAPSLVSLDCGRFMIGIYRRICMVKLYNHAYLYKYTLPTIIYTVYCGVHYILYKVYTRQCIIYSCGGLGGMHQ